MRRERNRYKFIIISIVVVSVLIALIIGFLITRGVKNVRENQFAGQMSKLSEELSKSDTVSSQIGKSVEEVKKEDSESEEKYDVPEISIEENIIEKSNTNVSSTEINNNEAESSTKQTNANTSQENKKVEEQAEDEKNSKNKKTDENEDKIKLEAPLKGEILRGFAKDSLVFSNTLQEWVTHNGVDIKADKTSVVKAAANGTVSAIKNDPRYGLTVIINHDNGYQTVYSNLLTAEFVVKGEKVEIGQSIGTVGNSASFEILDEYHLHFEVLKNNEYIDPCIYINFE